MLKSRRVVAVMVGHGIASVCLGGKNKKRQAATYRLFHLLEKFLKLVQNGCQGLSYSNLRFCLLPGGFKAEVMVLFCILRT